MRCLTLANELKARGHECIFICQNHDGHLKRLIENSGYRTYLLNRSLPNIKCNWNYHAQWLGTHWSEDAYQTTAILSNDFFDWLIVDHYSLDESWERSVRKFCKKILVIDDLADRRHDCDVIVDQTFDRAASDYQPLTSEACCILTGSEFSMLRPEFTHWRDYSLSRRPINKVEKILINFGGIDKDNITGKTISVFEHYHSSKNYKITAIIGKKSPWCKEVEKQALRTSLDITVLAGTDNMAEIMANSDLAIGAVGTTTWERCCLGLPSIVFIQAKNQAFAAEKIARKGAAILLRSIESFSPKFDINEINSISEISKDLVDGRGVEKIVDIMGIKNEQ